MSTVDLPLSHTNRPDRTPAWLTPGLRAGSEETWREFNFLYGGWIYSLARRWGLTKEDARDMVQEIMMNVYRSLHLFHRDRNDSTFQGWIYRIARNHVADHLERSQRMTTVSFDRCPESIPDPNSPDESFILPEEERVRLRARLEELAAGHFRSDSWAVFVAIELEGASTSEVSQQLHVNADTIRKQISRVRSWLRTLQATELLIGPPQRLHPDLLMSKQNGVAS
ncbi:sigma-70 family RNA polymerase sigma factor [Singulisphaera sp. Ch08]|uniref:Sigma-70 family RNA polymerase sigma factor n=1 Tax=Singulisphaera sp. Ch08 TaxID=3120278 RepID=A0AAU7C8A4_9BACT